MAPELLFLDFESFYDTKAKYDIKSCSMAGYIRDARFKAHGFSYAFGRNGDVRWVTAKDAALVLASFPWQNIILVAQNVKFDGAILKWVYGFEPAQYRDTLAMARAILGRQISGHSLGQLSKFFGFPPKGEMHTDGLFDLTWFQEQELAQYGMHDTWLCREIYYKLVDRFPVNQWPILDWTVRAFTEPQLELDGALLAETAKAEKERRDKIFSLIGIDKKVFSSNEKFAALLTGEGYDVPTKPSLAYERQLERVEELKQAGDVKKAAKLEAKLTPTIPAFALGDSGFLDMLYSDDQRLVDLCTARVAAKSNLLQTRSETFARLAGTGPFPVDLNFSGALQTHRFSGADGAGGNIQNLTRGSALRRAVRAPAGHVLLTGDFAAIEARIVAWLAGEKALIDTFTAGGSPYCDFATLQYGRPITKKDEFEYRYGKESILGLGYGMGWAKFKNRIKVVLKKVITDEQAQDTVNLYRDTYTKIRELWYKLDSYIEMMAAGQETRLPFAPFLLIKDGGIRLPSGLMLQYPNLRQEDGEWVYDVYKARRQKPERTKLYGGKLLENISQALAGEICKNSLMLCAEFPLNVVLQLHDELGVIAPHDLRAVTAAINLQTAMTATPPWWPALKLGCEVKAGASWGSVVKFEQEGVKI